MAKPTKSFGGKWLDPRVEKRNKRANQLGLRMKPKPLDLVGINRRIDESVRANPSLSTTTDTRRMRKANPFRLTDKQSPAEKIRRLEEKARREIEWARRHRANIQRLIHAGRPAVAESEKTKMRELMQEVRLAYLQRNDIRRRETKPPARGKSTPTKK